ncbi:MAG TPA: Ni/Fe-hydrogenase cytochrome b subunit [Candidatus Krumholzibacteria bacterium]|nr:Ni/Fe-hydrogenase cytochrome b subunit [Candidatus Krumholzibacteria bacterium]
MSAHQPEEQVHRSVWTPAYQALIVVALIATLMVAVRFFVGLGPMTNMTDVFPWGTWKVFNVIVLTALGSGGYALAFVTYVLNHYRYHPIVRHALLTSAVGYTIGIISLTADIGRPWNIWRVFVYWGEWNLDSVLLEVSLCVTAYVAVVWIELSPAFLERWRKSGRKRLAAFSEKALKVLHVIMPWIIAMGILLPTMHQSSLGSLYLLAGHKVHPLWYTPLIPALFLVSCWIMGYAMVIATYILFSRRYGRPNYDATLTRLAHFMAYVILFFGALRVGDLIWRDQFLRLFDGSWQSWLVILELVFVFVPGVAMIVDKSRRERPSCMFRMACFILLGGAMYRMDAGWLAFDGGIGAVYFPSVIELIATVGLIAIQGTIYLLVIKNFPILTEPEPHGTP